MKTLSQPEADLFRSLLSTHAGQIRAIGRGFKPDDLQALVARLAPNQNVVSVVDIFKAVAARQR